MNKKNRKKVADLGSILSKIKKGWIALSPDNKCLIATGSTLNEVLVKSKKVGINNPSVLRAAPINNFLVERTGQDPLDPYSCVSF